VRAVHAVVLVALLAGPVAYAHADHRVTLVVDGARRQVRSFAPTVGALLADEDVRVGPHDAVDPSLASPVSSGMTVAVVTARPVLLTVGPVTARWWTTTRSVGAFLASLGPGYAGAVADLPADTPIPPGGVALGVRLPVEVEVVVDGQVRALSTTATSWGAVLAAAGVAVVPGDRVSADPQVPVAGGVVSVTTVSRADQVVLVTVPYRTRHVPDAALAVGQREVEQAGVDGVVEEVWVVTRTAGRVSGRRLATERTVRATTDQVVAVGTAQPVAAVVVAPSPAPAPAPPPTAGGGVAGLDWTALATCESGDNPRAVGGDGQYFGLYQFSLAAWAGVGGTGNPINASPAEQTYRAELLYLREGRSAWPSCGALL
jgi:uncharacterized protein YabE (DUF348 family)